MNRVMCPGLDGSNPLHFLASLGVLRLLDRNNPSASMGWVYRDGAYRPVYQRTCEDWSMAVLIDELQRWIPHLGTENNPDKKLQRQERDLSAKIKKEEEDIKKTNQDLRRLKKQNDTVAYEKLQLVLREKRRHQDAQKEKHVTLQIAIGDALGNGIAHLGDIIGVTPGVFRKKAFSAIDRYLVENIVPHPATDDPQLVMASLAALGCDQVFDGGRLANTPYSFSNGGSGQCLLKDFRACAVRVTAEHVSGTLMGDPVFSTEIGSLGWDPAEQSLHALQWRAPEIVNKKGTKEVDPALQSLAFVGLSLVPAVPMGDLSAIGWTTQKNNRGIEWPIWENFFSLHATMSILVSPLSDSTGLRPGILHRFRCELQNPTGKRNYFSPSRSL